MHAMLEQRAAKIIDPDAQRMFRDNIAHRSHRRERSGKAPSPQRPIPDHRMSALWPVSEVRERPLLATR
jgi:hypothetical protein